MSLWRNVRTEMAGAWRSVCYDLGRSPEPGGPAGPDVTSTGMNTFPGSLAGLPAEPAEEDRPPRRFVAVTAFCALALCGAAGSYLVATTAFAGRMTDAPVIVPPAAAPPAPPPFGAGTETTAGGSAAMGGTPRKPRATAPAPAAPAPADTARIVVTPTPARENTRRATPVGGPSECDCDTPPVPTPTAHEPEPSASAPASAAPSDPVDPSMSAPAEPDFGYSVWMAPTYRHHRRHSW